MKTVCVFCGSRSGHEAAFTAAAEAVGAALGRRGMGLVYGGGNSGLMGATARAALKAGCRVTGIQPRFLDMIEPPTEGLTEFIVVDNMHDRKRLMYEKSDGFLVLPGALGTFDELFEVYTWAQLGLHGKPVAIWNVAGYYDLLLAFLDQCRDRGVLRAEVRALLLSGPELEPLLDAMLAYRAPEQPAVLVSPQQV